MANHTITVTVTIPQEYLRAHNLRTKKLGNQYALQHEHDHHRLAPLELFTQWENTPHQVLDYRVFDAETAQTQSELLQDRVRDAERQLEGPAERAGQEETWLEELMKPRPHFMVPHQTMMDRAADNMRREQNEAEEGLQRSQEEAARRRQRNRTVMQNLMRTLNLD